MLDASAPLVSVCISDECIFIFTFLLHITSAKEGMFICLSVSRITWKVVHKFRWKFGWIFGGMWRV